MKFAYSQKHELHAPVEIVVRGTVMPNLESPARAEALLRSLRKGDPSSDLAVSIEGFRAAGARIGAFLDGFMRARNAAPDAIPSTH